ncbi:MAG: efflux RND transporter permease subunit [Proteobacteria bacterium]|nr:efflux RND transporter permease subunit [Pseudomonadota bacterium]MBU4294417.1 efflux RND transporter permease subunit [Pseudomonadota bacterium]MCG2747599.1 efflux RND transporter permease subunit [Desulfobulbaceae bacterium]
MTTPEQEQLPKATSLVGAIIRFCLLNKLLVALALLVLTGWGLMVAPFDFHLSHLPRDPVPVDAIPDIGENQQIVFTEWPGRSPQDVEDQITYPLTVTLLGLPGVKTVRSYSMFGFSSIYVIFNDSVEFYWSRSRLLEKLASLPAGTLPEDVKPTLGPDATGLGQIFWYTLEGRDKNGNPTGGWELEELRSVQDWYVRYALMGVAGISEVASVGGFVKEYQIDVDPDAMRANKVTLEQVFSAVKMSNIDIGARTIEINRVEYVIRGIGFIKSLADIENAVIKATDNQPIRIADVAKVSLGPALRRGVLDKNGAEVVGGVAVARFGDNPLAAIERIKEKIKEISPGLPSKKLADGTESKITIVPFYDRSGLIHETLGTLKTALGQEILITIIVVLISLMHFKSSFVVSSLLPFAVLLSFIGMKVFGVDANIVALSGIAIAIGTIVDMGIIICENIVTKLDEAGPEANSLVIIYEAATEVGSAVLTAVSTTIVSFLPVFTMQAAEGKLFKPLAYTKTFALIASIILALTVLPPLAHLLFRRVKKQDSSYLVNLVLPGLLLIAGLVITWLISPLGLIVAAIGLYRMCAKWLPGRAQLAGGRLVNWLVILIFTILLARSWEPLGIEPGALVNFLFVALIIGATLGFLQLFQGQYTKMLAWCLQYKKTFLLLPTVITLLGAMIWLGVPRMTAFLPDMIRGSRLLVSLAHSFPGLGKEFMPPLDEGSFLYMPTTMPHASIGEVQEVLAQQDRQLSRIPEISSAVGKLGRADSPLDPAPLSMIETIINYHSEYLLGDNGERLLFKFRDDKKDFFRTREGAPVPASDGAPYLVQGRFERDGQGRLIADPDGRAFRLWRPALDPAINPDRKSWRGIINPDDIWNAIVTAAEIPGVTSAPKLQPIATRIVMLQTGMRAPMGIKVKGPDLGTIDAVALQLEALLKHVPAVSPATVLADRVVGKPYIEINIDREAIARYGIMLGQVQDVISVAVGGRMITSTVEGRERYPVRVRYLRELRDSPEELGKILVAAPNGAQIPLSQLADFRYVRGPQMIKSEDTFLTAYVLFDKRPGFAEVDVVEQAKAFLNEKIDKGELVIPAGVTYTFAGNYENQIRAQKRLSVILPLAMLTIMVILYLQFKSLTTTLMVFSSILVAWSGGFLMIWFYGQGWFLDATLFGVNMRDLFQVHQINLSVAIWVGFLALFGIASDDGVLMATYLDESKNRFPRSSREEIRTMVLQGAERRIRPALMTSSTTILALLPILTSSGRGADIMVPMAIPSFGGMSIALLTVFVVPVLYCWREECKLQK